MTNGYLFKKLDDIPMDILNFLEERYEYFVKNMAPDVIFDDDDAVVNPSKLKKEYRQWYMQEEPDHNIWRYSEFKFLENYLLQWVDDIFDFKFSLTSPKTEISWHNMHPEPRIHIPLSHNGCLFDIKDTSQKIHSYHLKKGKIYMINVCYPHRVRPVDDMPRKQALFSYKSVKLFN